MAAARKIKKEKPSITIPLTPYDLTITTFFGAQQLLINLSNKQDPGILIKDLAETLMVEQSVFKNIPIGSWDDDILNVLSDSYLNDIKQSEQETESNQETKPPEDIIPNTSQRIEIDTINPNNTEITLLGITRHLSNLIGELGKIAQEQLESEEQRGQRKPKNKPKDQSGSTEATSKTISTNKAEEYIKARKAKSEKGINKKTVKNRIEKHQTKKHRGLYELLPKTLWHIHKGTKYYLLGREADALIGKIPHNKLTASEYITVEEVERLARLQMPDRNPETNEIEIDPIIKHKNGKPTGKVLNEKEIASQKHALELADIDLAFNLTINQIAALFRRAQEVLPVNISDREYFLTERARDFQDLPAWIAFAIRGFFLERLLLHCLIPDGSLT